MTVIDVEKQILTSFVDVLNPLPPTDAQNIMSHMRHHNFVAKKNTICTSVKFIYSEKAKKICEIFTLILSYVVPVKSKVKISQNVVAFSEYMNFKKEADLNLTCC